MRDEVDPPFTSWNFPCSLGPPLWTSSWTFMLKKTSRGGGRLPLRLNTAKSSTRIPPRIMYKFEARSRVPGDDLSLNNIFANQTRICFHSQYVSSKKGPPVINIPAHPSRSTLLIPTFAAFPRQQHGIIQEKIKLVIYGLLGGIWFEKMYFAQFGPPFPAFFYCDWQIKHLTNPLSSLISGHPEISRSSVYENVDRTARVSQRSPGRQKAVAGLQHGPWRGCSLRPANRPMKPSYPRVSGANTSSANIDDRTSHHSSQPPP